jgi:DNA polymerase I-like protein with 3'-5' exonuclease and polymerase domains
MSDDFNDFFGDFEPQAVKRAKVKDTLECPILFCDDNPNLNVLVSEYFSEKQLKYISAFFHKNGARINIVYVFSVIFDEKRKTNSHIAQFFAENVRSDLCNWLEPKVPIVSVGRAIYATTFDTDIQIQGFYDHIFNNTFFYSQFINNRVYPIDSIFKICAFGQIDEKSGEILSYWDRWETHFAEKQIQRAVKAGNCSLPRKKSIQYFEVDDPNKWLQDHIDNIPENELWVAVDTETGGFNKLSDIIGDVTFSFDGWTSYHLDWNKVNPRIISEFLQKHKCIYANGKYDVLFFMFHGCDLLPIAWDTMIAGHLLNEMRSNSLKTHAFHYTNYGGYDLELEKFKWKYTGLQNYLQIPDSIRIPYACWDSAIAYQVWQAQSQAMQKEPELWEYYHKYCLPMLKVFIKAEYKGFCIDWNKVNEVGKQIQDKIKESLENVRKTFKNPDLNPSKKQELGKFIESLGWPCINRNKSGGFKVSKKEFAEWEKMGHAEVKTLIDYSKWMIVWNTFIGADSDYGEDDSDDINAEPEFEVDDSEAFDGDDFFSGVDKKYSHHDATGLWQYKGVDNRVHTTFYAFMTKSHRHRSSNPNLQNLPKRNKEVSSIVRQCYIPPDIVPCEKEAATQIWVFDRLKGLSLHSPDDLVEIGLVSRIKVPAKDLFKYDFKEYGYRAEYYRWAEVGEYVITETDGTNLQAMIAASMSHDKNLCNVFLSGGDFHNNNTYHILAKYQLFDECKITLNNGQFISGMEWETVHIESPTNPKDIYYGDIKEGQSLGALTVTGVQKTGRNITYEEFCANAKVGKCKNLRDIGKMIGLSFIFGASANNLAGGTLRMAWNPKMCADFIRDRGLKELQKSIVQSNKRIQGDALLYFVVASFFRSEFFKLYPELEKWIFECANIACNTGYRRSPWGSRRLLPQLRTKGAHADGGMYKNLSNIAVNSPVQDFETVVMACAMIIIDSNYEDLGYISYLVGTVHDSVVSINHISELNSCLRILLEAFNFDHPATYGMPYSGECNVADYTKGEFWGFGHREVKYKEVKDVPIIRKRYRTRTKAQGNY